MSEIIERVARAIENVNLLDYNLTKEEINSLAKAAIAAMREPTLFMTDSANGIVSTHECKEVWQTMIDAALKE